MKVCLMSTSDGRAGAFAAVYRLHQGLQKIGLDSNMLVSTKTREDSRVLAANSKLARGKAKLGAVLDTLPLHFYPNRIGTMFSPQWFIDSAALATANHNPDLINLHWINNGYLQIETFAKFNKPLVWTLHDMWAFTGGCHYNQDCDRYTKNCGACPQLGSTQNWDLSRWVWLRKAKAWRELNLTIVTPSVWLAKCASSSSLFSHLRVEVIPYGIDTQIYKPINRQIARDLLNLPQDKQLILFGAGNATGDSRKGFHLLEKALQHLGKLDQDKMELVIFGASTPTNKPDLGLKSHYLGKFSDDISLALVYAAADVFVAPSLQDNLPNTVMEAIACGTPCVAFNIGGMPDMIQHQHNGYLARPFEISDLAGGIIWILENEERHQKLCYYAREKAEQEFTLETQAQRYFSLYADIVDKTNLVNIKLT